MRVDLATRGDVELALERLSRVYPKLDVSPEAVQEWEGTLRRGNVLAVCLETAVDRYIDEGSPFTPKPGNIRHLAKSAQVELPSEAPDGRDDEGGRLCTSCGARFRFAGLEVGPKRVLCCALKCGCRDNRTGWRRDLDPWPEGFPIPGEESPR